MARDNDEPAFPHLTVYQREGETRPDFKRFHGMALRDCLAGKALPALIAVYASVLDSDFTIPKCAADLATDAYALADAMLAQRETP